MTTDTVRNSRLELENAHCRITAVIHHLHSKCGSETTSTDVTADDTIQTERQVGRQKSVDQAAVMGRLPAQVGHLMIVTVTNPRSGYELWGNDQIASVTDVVTVVILLWAPAFSIRDQGSIRDIDAVIRAVRNAVVIDVAGWILKLDA